jgi:hypothetical protein
MARSACDSWPSPPEFSHPQPSTALVLSSKEPCIPSSPSFLGIPQAHSLPHHTVDNALAKVTVTSSLSRCKACPQPSFPATSGP